MKFTVIEIYERYRLNYYRELGTTFGMGYQML